MSGRLIDRSAIYEHPARTVALAFVVAIAIGTALLLLPFSTQEGTSTDPLTALFTASSAICVTGLAVVDTGTYWSGFGQLVLLVLVQLGGLGLIAEPGGWSYEPDPEDGIGDTAQRSLVALVRGPRMVVEYYDAGRSRPFVRGVFVADDEVDDLLRQTEPKAHDSWQTRSDELGSDPDAAAVAEAVLRRVREHVRKFRDQLKPAARPAEDVRLPELERLFGRIFTGDDPRRGPPPSERPFTISVDQQIEPVANGEIRLRGSVSFGLADHFEGDHAEVELVVSYRFMEDGGNGEEAELVVHAPNGFTLVGQQPYRYVGQISTAKITIPFTSVPYPSDWTGRLKGDVVFARTAEPST